MEAAGAALIRVGHLDRVAHTAGVHLQRDDVDELTVIDYSICPDAAGRVRSLEYLVPDTRAQLPRNLTVCSFHRSSQGFLFVRAAALVLRPVVLSVLPDARGGQGRLIHADLEGEGLPFLAGDCLGWTHSGHQGLAYLYNESGGTLLLPVFTRARSVSTFRGEDTFLKENRTYAILFGIEVHTDPFNCWRDQPLLGRLGAITDPLHFEIRSQLTCCYFSPLVTMSNEMPACFGVVGNDSANAASSHRWYHPTHCCREIPLEDTLVQAVRCEKSGLQTSWRVALDEAAQCLQVCCPRARGSCTGSRLLALRQKSAGMSSEHKGAKSVAGMLETRPVRRRLHRQRQQCRRNTSGRHHTQRMHGCRWHALGTSRRRRQPLEAADCPAGAAILGLVKSSTALLRQPGSKHRNGHLLLTRSGRSRGGHCALHGFDRAACCVHHTCDDVHACAACLVAEVPWGHWSPSQRRLLAAAVRRLDARSPTGDDEPSIARPSIAVAPEARLPSDYPSAVAELFDFVASQPITEGYEATAAHIWQIWGFLVEALRMHLALSDGVSSAVSEGKDVARAVQALSAAAEHRLHEAVHVLQGAAPLQFLAARAVAKLVAALPPASVRSVKEPSPLLVRPSSPSPAEANLNLLVNCAVPASRRLASWALRPQRHLCGAAAAAFLAAWHAARSEDTRCCPASSWSALALAAAEGQEATYALVLCSLCDASAVVATVGSAIAEAAEEDNAWSEVHAAIGIILPQLTAAVRIAEARLAFCEAPPGTQCSCGVWEPVLGGLREAIACSLRRTFALSNAVQSNGGSASASVAPVPLASSQHMQLQVSSHSQTLRFLQRGGSLARVNDGEQLMMSPTYNAPLPRLSDTMLRLQIVVAAACPGLCVGLVLPDGNASAVSAIGETHQRWWAERGLRLTKPLIEASLIPTDRNYCFGLSTYRPKFGPGRMSTEVFAHMWDLVFANQTVLLVQPMDYAFQARCGGCSQISFLLYGGGEQVPPFRLATRLFALNPELLRYDHVSGAEWSAAVSMVRVAADEAKADTVAVVWGPAADILVAELVCRGLRAIDIGNLVSVLRGGQTARDIDPDESDEK